MSKRGYISRYLMVLRRLKAKPYSTYEELKGYMENQYGYLQMQDDTLDFKMSIRTFQRDIKEIRDLFGIDIEYSKARKGYHIIQTESENLNFQRMLEAFDMFNSLNLAHDLRQYVHLESRRPQGTENLYGFLHAIKNRFRVRFTYQKFWEEAVSNRAVEPYAMKEFKNRWYVIAKDSKDGNIKSFALDRLSDLEITNFSFVYPNDFNIEEMYRTFFGIISPFGEVPQDIILSFDPFQGKYIKTLPLHHTQKIITSNDEELRVSLNLCITYDFMMELLSFGDSMKILQPESLAMDVKSAHEKAFGQY
ncbi:helix-turn-helix transcriptional regulator [Rufibacter hautae]|uniref:WYL domain-containing protein n=1 Tax=Rufibacter hautae TaxID=2595005 RepID=A0A5B6T966_9BACT|nr:WYL domain-containing protein [Rufibacter hautae]KAA3436728.1 WYL domain-containing protein [Rufibacter hautae]